MGEDFSKELPETSGITLKFETYVLPEIQMLLHVAKTLTKNYYDAEDLVQETMLKAYKGIEAFDGKFPRAWLITIMRNTLINKTRKRRPDLLKDGDEADNISAVAAETPDRQVESQLFVDAVMKAAKRLPNQMLEVVQLIDVDGLSYPEASLALSIPLGTVMSRLHRARKLIRESLEKEGYLQNGESR